MLCPQTEVAVDLAATLEKGSSHPTALDALAAGTSTGIRLMVNIAAMLLVFIALVALANYLLEGLLGRYTGLNEWIVSVTDGKSTGIDIPVYSRSYSGSFYVADRYSVTGYYACRFFAGTEDDPE